MLAAAPGIKRIRGRLEEVLAAAPDLVVAGDFSHRETTHFLEKHGIPVLLFRVPGNFEEIYANIRRLAHTLGAPERGETLVQAMQKSLGDIRDPGGPRKRALLYEQGGYVPGAGTFEDAVITAAGLENAALEAGIRGHGRVPLEELIALRPDFVILAGDPRASHSVGRDLLIHPALERGLWKGRVLIRPPHEMTCGSPVLAEAARALAEQTGQAR
jgi:iron complex transport system substrate-binding protein